ncbi:hypothetical protein Fmac_032901 [Flemingia macrophylla]|uniref:Uncharacterized protein n=1 Tax=Flemingia macrophylla TaxID=520843 RepID=A0ABD1L7M4_9FABA
MRSLPLLQAYTASVLPMITILVSVLFHSNMEWMSILRLILQTPIADHHSSRDKALDREDGSQLLAVRARNDAIVIRGVHDVATRYICFETRKLEGKLDALVNLHPEAYLCKHLYETTTAARERHLIDKMAPNSSRFGARNDAIVIRGVHDMATRYICFETRKLGGKLDALVNLVTQLAAIQKPASVARVCDIRSSNDHHTSVCPSSQQSGVDAPANQKPAYLARVCGICSSNDHHTSVFPSSQQSRVDEHPGAYAANTYSRPAQQVHDVAADTSALTRKLEGKKNALVNMVTQLAANQKLPVLQESAASVLPMTTILESVLLRRNLEWMIILRPMLQTPIADYQSSRHKTLDGEDGLEGKLDALVNLVTRLGCESKLASRARVCGIHSSNDHHNSRDHHAARDKALDRDDGSQLLVVRLEGKLDALVNLVTRLALRFEKLASVPRVCDICSSNDHHTSFSARNDIIIIRGVHDVATDTSAETRNLEDKLNALVNLQTQQSSVDEHPKANAANTYSIRPQQQRQDASAETRKLLGKLDALVNLVTQLVANQNPASDA